MSGGNIFGTDGVRDRAGDGHLAADALLRLGHALARHLKSQGAATPRLLVAQDSRTSGPSIVGCLTAAWVECGCEVDGLGIVPTPAVSELVRRHGYDLGVVISASHNPPEFNGVKLFGSTGEKLAPSEEETISELYWRETPQEQNSSPAAEPRDRRDLVPEYVDFLVGDRDAHLAGMSIVIDCARGATTSCARTIFERAGANITALNEEPDGSRINVACGSLDPSATGRAVLEVGAQLGVAFDGDGDRAILVDEKGEVVDGDELLALWAMDLEARGELRGHGLVATVMSNAGMETYLREQGLTLWRTPVGDREVYARMIEEDAILGGEQSGHIIYRPEAVTGDGIRTGLFFADLIRRRGQSLSELRAPIPRFPQILLGVEVRHKVDFSELPEVEAAVEKAESVLGDTGRVLLRYSGTEPLARILIEGPDADQNAELAECIAGALRDCIALHAS